LDGGLAGGVHREIVRERVLVGVVSRFRAGPRTGILRFGGPKQEGLANRLNLNRLGGRDATVLSHIGTISSQSVWSGCPDFGQ
jgi:hypothetical protein